MSMAAPIRLIRLGVFVLLAVLCGHVCNVLISIWMAYQMWMRYGPTRLRISPSQYWYECLLTALNPYRNSFWWTTRLSFWELPHGRFFVAWGLLIPLPYLILADTMRRAKCRRMHLLRACAYFAPVVICATITTILFRYVPYTFVTSAWTWYHYHAVELAAKGLSLCLVCWYILWWWRFTKSYLRLERPRLVVGLLLAVSFLATIALASVLDKQMLDSVGDLLNGVFG